MAHNNDITDQDTIVVGKNRQRALWPLAIVAFMSLVSTVLILAGVLGRDEILWTPVWLGTLGLLGFGASAAVIVQTLRSPWHLPSALLRCGSAPKRTCLKCRGTTWPASAWTT